MERNKPLISDHNRMVYEGRLNASYKDQITEDILTFKRQFELGGGKELKDKFWRTTSSSRLCFDLYSWMADAPDVLSIRLEKKLPGIFSGGVNISPNMDVYFETESDIFFIESKYTETVNNKNYKTKQLPQAYWKTSDKYKNSKNEDTFQPIIKRYRDNEIVMSSFLEFIDFVSKKALDTNETSWFDAKQETCHLIGIIFYAIEKRPTKPIHFFNVAANYKKNSFAEEFRNKAEEMIRVLLKIHSIDILFDYRLYSVKDFFTQNGYLEKKAFQSNNTVLELITNPDLYDISENPIL